jgi:ubiquinone/menaquinone biosynthesis C-methylase UbiE
MGEDDAVVSSDEQYRKQTRHHYMDSAVADRYGVGQRSVLRAPAEWTVARLEIAAIKSALRSLRVPSTSSVLDIPAGTGKLQPLLTGRFSRYLAMDVSREMLRHVDVSVPRLQADATQLPLGDDAVDIVVVLRLLHRVPPDVVAQVLTEASRVARLGVIASYAGSASSAALHRVIRAVGRRADNSSTVLPPGTFAGLVGTVGGTIVFDRSISMGATAERVAAFRLPTAR